MCVAIYKPPGKQVSKKDLKACWDTNHDGAGFMYPKDGKVIVVKGLMTWEDFWGAYKERAFGEAAKTGMAIHFRIGTSGKMDAQNTHPHILADDFAFIHNGVLSEYSFKDSERSDTHHFMEDMLRPLYDKLGCEFVSQKPIAKLLAEYIDYSKMVLCSGSGKMWILNKKAGTERHGVWFSNMNWSCKNTYTPGQRWNRAANQWEDVNKWGGADDTAQWYGRGYNSPAASNSAETKSALFSYNQHGCWVDGGWMSWPKYEEAFPNGGGPYEKHRGKFANFKKKEVCVDGCTPREIDPIPMQQGTFSELGREDLEPDPITDQKCVQCEHALTTVEVESGGGYCMDCLLNAGAMGRQ